MFLYGAGGHAKVIMDIVHAEGGRIEALIDDNDSLKEVMGVKVISGRTEHISPLIVSIGNNKVRKLIAEKVTAEFACAVHPSAIIAGSVCIGAGTVVMQGAIIQSCASVGRHCIINTGASVDHECQIGDYVSKDKPLAFVHAQTEDDALRAEEEIRAAVKLDDKELKDPHSAIIKRIKE